MTTLIEIMEELAQLDSHVTDSRFEIEHRFIEILTFASFQEINEMLHKVDNRYWIEFPIWARNLSYRIACLMEPSNAKIKRRAAADLYSFGPDWDSEADKLIREAEKIEMSK